MSGHIELAVLSKGWRRDVPMSWTGLHTPNDGRLTAAFSLKGFNRCLFTCFFTTSTKHMSFSQEVCACFQRTVLLSNDYLTDDVASQHIKQNTQLLGGESQWLDER